MRAAPLFVLSLLLAGCASAPTGPAPTGPTDVARLVYAPDCSIASAAPWPEPCLAWASRNPSPSKTEIDIAVHPTDPTNVVVGSKDLDPQASACVWAVPQASHDGGRSWTTRYIGGKKAERAPGSPLFGWACVTDPIMAYDSKGVLYYTLQAYDFVQKTPLPFGDTGSAMLLARSKDGGDSWDKVITLHAGEGNVAFHDYVRMASNPKTGSVYSVWNQLATLPTPVGYATAVLVATRDGGESAAPPVYVPVPGSPVASGQSGLAVAADGTVYLALMSFETGGDVYLAVSNDDAQTFATPSKAFTVTPIGSPLPGSKFRVGTSVELAVDQSGGASAGCLYAAWADGGEGEGDSDVRLARTCDMGKTWSEPVRVNRDPAGSDQFMPRIVVDARGTVHVAYLTRSYHANHTLLDAEHAYSTDAGASWVTKRLTTVSFDGDKGLHQDGFPFIGDYIGIASALDATYIAFPTTATNVAEVAVALVKPVD